MAENTPITIYTADCIGNAANCLYPNEVKITDDFSAKLAFSTDMVCARYKNNYRNTANFEVANALPGDCDNDHSEIAADWVTPEDIAEFFVDVPYVLHFSRHHMKPKGEKSARPRFHIVFLIDPERNADRYTALKQRLLAAFPFFDANAMDAARFLFGTEDPQVIYHPGTITLNAFLDDLENEQAFANMGHTIPEGSRNSTMSRIGAKIIKRYGDTAKSKELFLQAAEQCVPPLEDVEDSHPAIIEPWEWEQVQAELERRKNSRTRHRQTSPFSGKIFCADCGEIFGSKTWHSTDRYRRIVWQCNGKFKREHKCETPHLTEEQLKELFLAALGEYLSDRDAAIDQLRYAQRMLTDTDFIDADIQALEEELTTITGKLRLCITEDAANATTEEAYRTTHADLCHRF